MLINVKMPTVVGILTFRRMIIFMLRCVEYEKKNISSVKVMTQLQPKQEEEILQEINPCYDEYVFVQPPHLLSCCTCMLQYS